MMVVTHEMGFARKVANRVIFMDKGEIVEDAARKISSASRAPSARSCFCQRSSITDSSTAFSSYSKSPTHAITCAVIRQRVLLHK